MSDTRRRPASITPRLVAFVLVALAIGVSIYTARPPRELTIETGPIGGSFYQDAQAYRAFLAERGINLHIRPKPNSLEIVGDVADPNSGVDIGFTAQDESDAKDLDVLTLGHTELQPLFIFASAELGRRSTIDDLRGRRIVMPPVESATSDAAKRVFKLYDITQENSSFTFMPLVEAVRELRAGRFEAGVFMLAPESPVIRELTADSGLRMVPFGEAKAVANHLPFLRPVVLPRGIYNIADSIPPNDTTMVAAAVDVVVRKDLHPYLVYSMLEAVANVHRGATFLSTAGEFPTIAGCQLTVHPLAAQFYREGLPWTYSELPSWLAAFVGDYLIIVVGIILLAGLFMIAAHLADGSSALTEWIATRVIEAIERSAARRGGVSWLQRQVLRLTERMLWLTPRGYNFEELIARARRDENSMAG